MFDVNALVVQKFGIALNMMYHPPMLAESAPRTTQECRAFSYSINDNLDKMVTACATSVAAAALTQE